MDAKTKAVLTEPVIVRFSTVQPDGSPHTVPIWFMLDQEDLLMFTSRTSRKVLNVAANGKGNISIGGDPVGSPCYLIQGEVTVEEETDFEVTRRITYHYEDEEQAEKYLNAWKDADFVILRLSPTSIIKIS